MKDRILLIDDSRDFRVLFSRFLKTSGYETAEAKNGEDGLQKIGEFKPDLILLDVMMPGINGYEVCKRIKADPSSRDIPVIFMAGRSEATDKILGLSVGAGDYITKPFDKGEAIARIVNQLKMSHFTKELIAINTELMEKQRNITKDLTNDLKSRIVHGETAKFEFKSSLRWNLEANKKDNKMELAALKTIVAFCNTQGGELLIGVADNHTILGIEQDHFENEDKFLLHLRNLITDKIIPSVVSYVEYELLTIDNKRICLVSCKQSKEDVWLKPDKNTPEVFYVRSGPSSTELPPRDAFRYIQEHFQKMTRQQNPPVPRSSGQ